MCIPYAKKWKYHLCGPNVCNILWVILLNVSMLKSTKKFQSIKRKENICWVFKVNRPNLGLRHLVEALRICPNLDTDNLLKFKWLDEFPSNWLWLWVPLTSWRVLMFFVKVYFLGSTQAINIQQVNPTKSWEGN